MNFLEAMRKVRDEGKRVRRTDKPGEGIVYKDEDGIYRESFGGGEYYFIVVEKYLDTLIDSTWEVVDDNEVV